MVGADRFESTEASTQASMSAAGGEARPDRGDGGAGELRLGDHLGQFRVEARIGSGGLGVVYRAYDVKLKRHVALKILAHGEAHGHIERLLAEARSAASLTHPSIATVHDVLQIDGVAFLVMELVEGRSLREELASVASVASVATAAGLPIPRALSLARDIAAGIARAHAAAIVHRDLKPENIVVTPSGAAKILDFGLATEASDAAGSSRDLLAASAKAPAAVRVAGSRNYMAPEQAAGHLSEARGDIFSFGVVFYEMIAGQRPFAPRAESDPRRWSAAAGDWSVVRPLRAVVPSLPASIEAIVERCLALDPAARFANGDELASALAAVDVALVSPRSEPSFASLSLASSASGSSPPASSRRASVIVLLSTSLLAIAAIAALVGKPSAAVTSDPALRTSSTRAAAAVKPDSPRRTVEAAGQTWEIVDGEWSVDGADLVGRSGHAQTTASLADGTLEIDVKDPGTTFATVGIGFRYSLTGGDARAQCGYGFNFHGAGMSGAQGPDGPAETVRDDAVQTGLESASFLGEDGDWGPVNGGYHATPAMHVGWNHLAIQMNGASFVVQANGQKVDAFKNARWTDGRVNLYVARAEIRFANVHLLSSEPVARPIVER